MSITAAALTHKGHPYIWGAWDCSGFVNHVLAVDCGLAIPGFPKGKYRGPPPHGPVVLDYATWAGAATVRGQPAPGDLAIWPGPGADGHIGIVLGPNKMISALNQQLGTTVSPIIGWGPAGVALIYRRVTGADGGTGQGGIGGAASDLKAIAAGALAGLGLAVGSAAAVLLAAAAVGVVGAALIAAAVAAASRAAGAGQ